MTIQEKLIALRRFMSSVQLPLGTTFRQVDVICTEKERELKIPQGFWKLHHSEEIKSLIYDIEEVRDSRGWVAYEEGLDIPVNFHQPAANQSEN